MVVRGDSQGDIYQVIYLIRYGRYARVSLRVHSQPIHPDIGQVSVEGIGGSIGGMIPPIPPCSSFFWLIFSFIIDFLMGLKDLAGRTLFILTFAFSFVFILGFNF